MSNSSERCLKLGMIAKKLLENNKGIFAADESPSSIQKRFDKVGIVNSEETRCKFREILFSSEGIEKYIGGVILHEETFSQKNRNGAPLIDILKSKDICIGIKLDKGLTNYKKVEKVSVGLEDLHLRIKKFTKQGASFAKWRSLFIVGENIPTDDCILENSNILARYAKVCQENYLVPIVEPEMYFEGNYTIEQGERYTKHILSILIQRLNAFNVYIPGVLVKMSFVTQGSQEKLKSSPREIATRTMNVLLSTVPCGVPGIVFLSGGHSQNDSIEYLNALNKCKAYKTWCLSFSYGRCLSEEPLAVWKNKNENIDKAKKTFINIAQRCAMATKGNLDE